MIDFSGTLELVLEKGMAATPTAQVLSPASAKGCREIVMQRGKEMLSLGFDIAIKEEADIFGSGSLVRVKAITEGGMAATTGNLNIGDQLVQVNGIKLATCHPSKFQNVHCSTHPPTNKHVITRLHYAFTNVKSSNSHFQLQFAHIPTVLLCERTKRARV